MKKKLFTLLLAAAGLSIFQANAEQKLEGWIRVDKSGLAKNVSEHDSFPNQKKGFNSWLSVKDNTVYVQSQNYDSKSSEIAADTTSVFSVDSVAPGRFKIKSKNGTEVFFNGKWDAVDVDVSTFEIVQFDKTGKKVVPAITNNSIEGYVVFPFTGQDQTAGNAVLAGVDKDGKISFKAFSEFAVHSDSVPASPWLSYQFTKDTVKGKLYQSDTYPYFQTYHKDSALVASGGSPIDWNKGETKSQNPGIFTYYDFKYDGNGGIFFNTDTFTLQWIVDYIKTGDYKESETNSITDGKNLSGIDTTSFANDSLLYLQVDDKNHITFTALTAGKEWTNGEPSKLPWESDSVWYYIDATDTTKAFYAMVQVLIDLFKFEADHFIPSKSNIERYIYKKDDNWRPLYIKAVLPTQVKPYKYVTEEWLKEKDFDLVAATQHVFGFPDLAISEDATVVSTENDARLSFDPAARIGIDSTISELTGPKFAGVNIDLFHIKNGDEYLTVSKVAYSSSGYDSTVANTKLNWDKEKLTGADSFRQAFAIVHDTDSSIFTFLPVASYKYRGTEYGNALHYNQRIGETGKDDQGKNVSVDIDTAWHITFRSVAPQLVITDKPDDENIWLKLAVELNHYWEESVDYEDSTFTVVYGKDKTHHYSAAGKFANAAGALLTDSIRSHWRVKYIEPEDNKPRVAFTPRIDTIYEIAQNKALTDTVFALELENGKIALVTYNNRSKRDTVEIESIKSTYTLPFKNLDHLDSLKVAILASGSESYNLSNDNGNAVLKPITATSDTFRVVLHKSNVQTLADGLHVPYYIFSTPDSLFLRANTATDSVEWVKVASDKIASLLDETKWESEYAPYKFSLPYKGGVESDAVYLQTLHSPTHEDYGLIVNGSVLFSVNASSFESVLKTPNKYVRSEGIYSALDQYKDNVKAAFWEIRHVGPGQATGLKKVVSSSAKIYGVAGGVRVIDASGSVSVYTVDGRLVSTGAVVSPDQTIAVPAGIYIVKNGVNAVKVVVK